MGCDAYADENGVVVIEVCSYDDPSNPLKRGVLQLDRFSPNERLSVEWICGVER